MSFEVGKTLSLIQRGLINPVEAWGQHFAQSVGWRDTALLITVPLVVGYAVLAALLAATFGGAFGMPNMGFFGTLLMTLLSAGMGVVVGAFVFSLIGGMMGGTGGFSQAFAAVSLAAIPAFLGGLAAIVIPFIGGLLALGGAVLSLIYLYRLLPLALAIPDDKRVIHFVVSLVSIFFANILLGVVVALFVPDQRHVDAMAGAQTEAEGVQGSGAIGYMQRQASIMEQAGEATYTPPGDGKVTEAQLEYQLLVRRKVRAAQERLAEQMKAAQEELEENPDSGFANLSAVGSGFASMMGMQNAEMEIVVTGGGNWSEYNWVKSQLQTASLQGGEGSAAIEHNFALLSPHRDALGL